jgi:hypothetical protein
MTRPVSGRQEQHMLAAQQAITTWEKYLLSFELLESRREQVRATAEYDESHQRLWGIHWNRWQNLLVLDELQTQVERGLAQASSLDERMQVMMGMVDTALQAGEPAQSGDLGRLKNPCSAKFNPRKPLRLILRLKTPWQRSARSLRINKPCPQP